MWSCICLSCCGSFLNHWEILTKLESSSSLQAIYILIYLWKSGCHYQGERENLGVPLTRESASTKDSAPTRHKRFHMKNYVMTIPDPDKTSLKMHTQFAPSELSSQIKSIANQAPWALFTEPFVLCMWPWPRVSQIQILPVHYYPHLFRQVWIRHEEIIIKMLHFMIH